MWRENAGEAAAAREVVAGQAVELLRGHDMPGGSKGFARRLHELAAAQRADDLEALRAAVMDCAVEALAWAATLDQRTPAGIASRRRASALR